MTLPGTMAWWFKADYYTSTSDGTAMSDLHDSSGNGWNVTQSTGTKQAKFYNNIVNSKPAVLFDDANSQMYPFGPTPRAMFNGKAGATVVAVVTDDDRTATRGILGAAVGDGASGNARIWANHNYATTSKYRVSGRVLDADAQGNLESTATTDASWHIEVYTWDVPNKLMAIYVDGATLVSPTAWPNAGTASTWTDAATPAYMSLGSTAGGGGSFWSGYMAEVILYTRVLDSSEIESVFTDLGSKYGITVGGGITTVAPASDITTTNWSKVPSGAASFAATLADSDDGTYCQSPDNPSSSILEVKFASLTDPSVHTNHTLKYRAQSADATSGSCTASIYQGATLIKAFSADTLTGTVTEFTHTLSEAEAANISDYTDLRVRFSVTAS